MNAPEMSRSASHLDPTSIQAVVLQAVRTANLARDASSQLDVSATAPLFGSASPLDSIGLVALLLDIEEAFDLFSHQRDGVMKVAIYPTGLEAQRRVRSEHAEIAG